MMGKRWIGSYVCGGGKSLLGMTIGDALRRSALKYANKEALISCHENTRWTWDELLHRAESFSKGLVNLGLPRLSRVGIYAPNKKEWLIAQCAASLCDLILVNINPAYQSVELEYTLNKVEISALIMTPSFKSSNYINIMESICPELKNTTSTTLQLKSVPSLRHIIIIHDENTGNKSLSKALIKFDDLYYQGGR
jgi:fatty-acyl-CoA synthase